MPASQSRKVWFYLLAGAVLGLVLGGMIVFLTPLGDNLLSRIGVAVPLQSPTQGSLAPDFELVSLSGAGVRLMELRGKPVLLNFWATWCAPCVLEMPNIQKFYERYPGQFEVLAINADEPAFEVQQFVAEIGVTFPVLLDPAGDIQELYRIRGYPMSFFLDSDGRIQIQHIGMLQEDQIKDYLAKMGIIE